MTERPAILIVEDDDDLRELLYTGLAREEYDITSAASGEDAPRKMSILSFDLVITDIRRPDISVIVLTAYPALDTAVSCLRAGVHDYLFKPCPITEIRRSLREGLTKRQGFTKRLELLQALEQQLTQGLRALRGETSAS